MTFYLQLMTYNIIETDGDVPFETHIPITPEQAKKLKQDNRERRRKWAIKQKAPKTPPPDTP